jgi:hypothetical protein
MLSPTSLFPTALGLAWGMSQEACLTTLEAVPTNASPGFAELAVLVDGNRYTIRLLFYDTGKLERIESVLRESHPFGDNDVLNDMASLEAAYQAYYTNLVAASVANLGRPRFSGTWETVGYPEEQTASHITYWDYPDGRAQIEYDHPDRELPIIVMIATYPRLTEAEA